MEADIIKCLVEVIEIWVSFTSVYIQLGVHDSSVLSRGRQRSVEIELIYFVRELRMTDIQRGFCKNEESNCSFT